MQENPWHLRFPTAEHSQWFKNLLEFHLITESWVNESTDKLAEKRLEDLVGEKHPQELLNTLTKYVWTHQSSTLLKFKESESSLKTNCKRLGGECARFRWPALAKKGNQNLLTILNALNDSPFAGYPYCNGFLIRRATLSDVQIELNSCPHQMPYEEVKKVANPLCLLHAEWINGFVSALNSKVEFKHSMRATKTDTKHHKRCVQQWSL